ncbi:MAG: AraC family transcriptional regulator [Spirochaetes bacterium]|nr:AraC family transcriptional regulator [Spirochaetota bacterium]
MSFYDFFVFFASGLAILMAVGLLLRPLLFRNVAFSMLLIFISYTNIFMYRGFIQSLTFNRILFLFIVPIVLLIGPFIYLYIRSLTNDTNKVYKKDLLHLIPLAVILLIVVLFTDRYSFNRIGYFKGIFSIPGLQVFDTASILSAFSIMTYLFFSIRNIIGRIKSGNPVHERILIFLVFLNIGLFIGIIGIAAIFTQSEIIHQFTSISVSVFITLIFLISQRNPYLLEHGTISINKKKHAKSRLSNIDLSHLNKQLTLIMEKEKFYCDEDLTLARLSEALEVTPHQLSEFLNDHHNKNFNNYINAYRINEAKEFLLEDPNRNALSIAYATGFNSYSAFHTSFKKETGMSPAEFRKLHLKGS